MRTNATLLLFGLPFVMLACNAPPDEAGVVEAHGAGVADTGDSGWNTTLGRRFNAESVAIRARGDEFGATQHDMDLDLSFRTDGTWLSAGAERIGLRTHAVRRDQAAWAVPRVAPRLGDCAADAELDIQENCLPRLEYAHGVVSEWWESRPGLVQVGWDLDEAPPGNGPVILDVLVQGAAIEPGGDDRSVALVAGGRQIEFAGLRAWDDNGRELDAWMEIDGTTVSMVVDDSEAIWPIHLDPTTLSASWSKTGDSSTWFGRAVGGAGDVNNDGYDDIIVGAWYYSSYTGRAYVFHGAASGPSSTPAATLTGVTTNVNFGQSVDGAGDINNDGYDDVIVGAPSHNYSYGTAYIYYGSSSGISTTADDSYSGSSSGLSVGISVAGAGDVNKDGYDDVVIGAYGYASYTGRAYVFHGSAAGIGASPDTTLTGATSYLIFGQDVDGAGDVNGDGFSDVIVGAPQYNSDTGYVQIFHGSATGVSSTAAQTLNGAGTDELFGYSVSGAGDVDNDGFDDVIVGAYYDNSRAGRADIFHGSSSGIEATATTSISGLTSASFGYSVAGAGDIDGDGYDDVAVGAYNYSSSSGLVRTYYGSAAGISSSYGGTVTGSSSMTLGVAVAGAGDVNNDGRADILAGGYAYSSSAGYAALYFGSADQDGDGYYVGAATNPDCDDTNSAIKPGATEATGDEIDQNCDGAETCYDDDDGDGYLDSANDTRASTDSDCDDANEGSTSTPKTDCDDASSSDYPGAAEIVGNGDDEDCDGTETCYDDDDNDGYLDSSADTRASSDTDCTDTYEGTSSDLTTDCDDTTSTIKPGATEGTADEIDQNCDGAETCYDDDDGDGFLDSANDTRASTDTDCDDANEGSTSTPKTDCDDASSSDYPGAAEIVGNGDDEDCDGEETCFDDVDNDGYLDTSGSARTSADSDCTDAYEGTTSDLTTDCDDSNSAIKPGATEGPGDEIDQNCDGAETCYDDDDGDGFLDSAGDTRASSDTDCGDANEGSTSTPLTDCDDASVEDYPGASEIVGNGDDEDCDGNETCYDDGDGDGYLDTSGSTRVSADTDCADLYEGTAATLTTDCDDTNSAIKPGAAEVTADEIDQNCDGAETCYDDGDGDGFLDFTGDTRASTDTDCDDANEGSTSTPTTDCNEGDAATNPAAIEIVGDGVDQTCDGEESCFSDNDNDGFLDTTGDTIGSFDIDCDDPYEGTSVDPTTDCNDTAPAENPDATEIIVDGIDQDCDGGDLCYEDSDGDDFGSLTTRRSADLDCTGAYESLVPTDCDDLDSAAYPLAPEVTADGIDQDCDGGDVCYLDVDSDGYAGETTGESADRDCDDPGEGLSNTDCDDTNGDISPAALEVAGDQLDQNCDGEETCFEDDDGDGYLDDSADTRVSTDLDCTDANEAAATAATTDCNDEDAATHPAASEVVGDGVDQTCDGQESCFYDNDDDGYLDATADTIDSPDADCDDPFEGTVADATTDCNDAAATEYPGATEVTADGVDQDCDAGDLCFEDNDGDQFGSLTIRSSTDLDCTGAYESLVATDCDDLDSGAYPGATEVTADGVDQDCDGGDVCYLDLDLDSYAGETVGQSADRDCDDAGEGLSTTDCNDEDAAISPAAAEVVGDQFDQNCDGQESCFYDNDDDGYLDATADTIVSPDLDCDDPFEGSAADATTDCNDAAAAEYPGAAETCNGQDDNCSGEADEGLPDCGEPTDSGTLDSGTVDSGGADTGEKERDGSVCGCGTNNPASALGAVAALGLLARRRSRATSRVGA